MRDRNIRNAIKELLIVTERFDDGGVLLQCPDDRGVGTDLAAACWIEPSSTTIRDEWDAQPGGGVTLTSILKTTFAYRAEDPQARDEACENLLEFAANVLNGQSIGGFTIPAWTKFVGGWQWLPPAPPERRIVATFSYQYILEGWNSYDTEE
jgi:hypothetical protein